MFGGIAEFGVTNLKDQIKRHAQPELGQKRARMTRWDVDLEVRLVFTDVDVSLVAFYQYGDPDAVEVTGTRVCHNIRGLLDPRTD